MYFAQGYVQVNIIFILLFALTKKVLSDRPHKCVEYMYIKSVVKRFSKSQFKHVANVFVNAGIQNMLGMYCI